MTGTTAPDQAALISLAAPYGRQLAGRGTRGRHLNLGQYDEAIAACEKALTLEEDWPKHLFLLGALAQKGDMAKAEVAKAQLLKLEPDISIARLKAPREWANPLYEQQREDHLYAGLRKVGIPERWAGCSCQAKSAA